MKKLIFSIATASTLFFSASTFASSVTIDSFNSPEFEHYAVSSSTPDAGATNATAGVIGGYRSTAVHYVSGHIGGSTAVVGGSFNYSSDATTKIKSLLTWDGNGEGLGGVDLRQGASSLDKVGFKLDILDIDQGKVDLTFNIIDSANNKGSILVSGLGKGLQYVLFSKFTNLALDFTSIQSISLGVTQLSAASDLTIDFFEVDAVPPSLAAPIPAAVFLFGSGLVGLVALTKRKKDKNVIEA